MTRLIEIRAYRLKPGVRDTFHTAMIMAVRMLREWGTDVVAFGPSGHDPDAYFLIRSYDDLADRNARQDAFYGSDAWRGGPRESVVPLIDAFLDTHVSLSEAGVEDLRRSNGQGT